MTTTTNTSRKLPSKAHWARLEQRLYEFGDVELRADGYTVTPRVCLDKRRRLVIMPYVNGDFLGKWITDVHGVWPEEGRRFLPLRKHYIFNQRLRRDKKFCKAMKAAGHDVGRFVEYRAVGFSSFSELRRHLIANNHDIEIIKPELPAGGVDAAP